MISKWIASCLFLPALAFGSNEFVTYINHPDMKYDPGIILKEAINSFNVYSDGYGNPGLNGHGYINVLKLEIGISKRRGDPILDEIAAYDRAESKGAYIGQINMISVSSFNGVNGLVWGYDLAKEPEIEKQKPLFFVEQKGEKIPVYSVDPLLKAGERLLGTAENPRFQILPGAMVRSAIKSATVNGPTYIWSAISISMAANRKKSANLFLEDAGNMSCYSLSECEKKLHETMKKMATTSIEVGNNAHVKFSKIYLGFKVSYVPDGHVGTAITAAPYLTLPKKALPEDRFTRILNMNADEWEEMIQKNVFKK